MASALFSVNGSSAQEAHTVTFGSTVTYALASISGVNRVTYTIFGGDGRHVMAAPTTAAGIGNATHTMPADPGYDVAFGVECVVNGGLDETGRPDPSLRCRRVIGTMAHGVCIPLVSGETTERSASHGWVRVINTILGKIAP